MQYYYYNIFAYSMKYKDNLKLRNGQNKNKNRKSLKKITFVDREILLNSLHVHKFTS